MKRQQLKKIIKLIVEEAALKENHDTPIQNMMPKQKFAVDALRKRQFSIQNVTAVSGGVVVILLRPKGNGKPEREAKVFPDGSINDRGVDIKHYLTLIDNPLGEVMFGQERDDHRFDDGREPVMRAVNIAEGMHDERPCDCGSGLMSHWQLDGRGIPLCRVCPNCKTEKLKKYRPEILKHYTQDDVDEPIEPDQQEEQTGTGAVAGYSTPFAFKKRKNEMIGIDGRYQDDMASGVTAKKLAGLEENVDWIMVAIKGLSGLVILKGLSVILGTLLKYRDLRNHTVSDEFVEYLFSRILKNCKNFEEREMALKIQELIKKRIQLGQIKTVGDLKKHVYRLFLLCKAESELEKEKGGGEDKIDEMTGTGAVAGYSTPFAFSKRSKEGSPRAIAATVGKKGHKTGFKVVKSISTESIK